MNISCLDPSQQFNSAILSACLAWILISLGMLSRSLSWRLSFQMRQLMLELRFSSFAFCFKLGLVYFSAVLSPFYSLSQFPYVCRILALIQSRSCSRLGTWSFYKPSIMLWSSEEHEFTVVLGLGFWVWGFGSLSLKFK